MSEPLHTMHTVSVVVYHVVCSAKYRRTVVTPAVDMVIRDVCLAIADRYEIRFLEIGTDRDHGHFLVQSVPMDRPTKSARVIQSLTAREVFQRVPTVKKQLWGGQFWSDGSSISTVGQHGTEAQIRDYVAKQGRKNEYKQLHGEQLSLV